MSNEPINKFPNGHLQMRNGILDHLVDGKMTPDMFTAYYLMLARCNFATGVWHGSAERLVAETGGVWSLRTAQRVLERLLDGGYISSTHKRGKRGNYDILISNYVPTIGEHRGKKLRPRTVDQLETSSDSTVTTKSDATGDAASESSDKSDDTGDATQPKVTTKVTTPVASVQEGVQEIGAQENNNNNPVVVVVPPFASLETQPQPQPQPVTQPDPDCNVCNPETRAGYLCPVHEAQDPLIVGYRKSTILTHYQKLLDSGQAWVCGPGRDGIKRMRKGWVEHLMSLEPVQRRGPDQGTCKCGRPKPCPKHNYVMVESKYPQHCLTCGTEHLTKDPCSKWVRKHPEHKVENIGVKSEKLLDLDSWEPTPPEPEPEKLCASCQKVPPVPPTTGVLCKACRKTQRDQIEARRKKRAEELAKLPSMKELMAQAEGGDHANH
jgi:hypothetical protein